MKGIAFEQHLKGQVRKSISKRGNGMSKDMDAVKNKILGFFFFLFRELCTVQLDRKGEMIRKFES